MSAEETAGFSRVTVWLAIALFTGAVIAAWGWNQARSETNRLAFETVLVERGDVVQSVLATGELNPVRTVQVGSQISGNIRELLADFNSVVQRGDVIARIDPAIYEANVSLAEAELERAEAAYDLAHVQWERVRSLHERLMISDSELDEARAQMRQAEANQRMTGHELEKAQLELDRCTITSPVDGIVISRNVDVGQTVAASLSAPVLFEIAEDLGQMEINTFVSEADIGRIEEGQRVEFRVDAYRDQPFAGKVWQVRHAPSVMDNVVTYDAVVRVDNPQLQLKPGMTAEVDFITSEEEDVLRVRNTALRARLPDAVRPATPDEAAGPGERTAYRLGSDGTLEAVQVRPGISDGMHTEILSGLREGDELVTGIQLHTGQDRTSGPTLLQGRQEQF